MPDLVIALYEPEIPPNTGSIMRLAANTGAALALIEPLAFELSDSRLRRAGLDYRDLATTTVYPDLAAFLEATSERRMLAFSTRAECRTIASPTEPTMCCCSARRAVVCRMPC